MKTKTQIIILWAMVLALCATNIYACWRFNQALGAAIYWQQKADQR